MRTDAALSSAININRRLQLSVIILAALAVGIYMLLTTAVISKDGVKFIAFAKAMQTSSLRPPSLKIISIRDILT